MYNDTLTGWFQQARDNILNVSGNRWMEIGSSLLFFILISRGRKLWLDFLTFAILVEGFVYAMCPQMIDKLVTGQMDDVHYQLIRYSGVLCIVWGLGYFLVCKSTDETTQTSYLLSFTLMLLCCLLTLGNLCMNPPKKSVLSIDSKWPVTLFYILMLWAVGSLFYTVSAKDWGGYGEQRSHANFHLRVWFVMLFVVGIIDYAMPQWAIRTMFDLEKVDALHVLLTRSCASMVVGMALLVFRAANFLRTTDKDALIVTHLVCMVCLSMMYAWTSVYSKWDQLSWKRIGSLLILDVILLMNLFGTMNRDLSVFKRVILPRVKAMPHGFVNYFKFKQY